MRRLHPNAIALKTSCTRRIPPSNNTGNQEEQLREFL